MTVLRSELAKLARAALTDPIPGAPDAEITVAPKDLADAATILRFAAQHRLRVLFWGGGTHQGIGHEVTPDVVMSSRALNRVIEWQVEDLTIAVESGVLVSDLEAQLEQRGQTAVLPEDVPGATVGGVVACGLSGWRRLRYGPTRDRVIEVTAATGDGRQIRGGGRLVKNVTGYDLPRLYVGSLGALGLIGSVCLKLWPLTAERAMVDVTNAGRALEATYRPHALLETEEKATVYLAGTAEEVAAQAERLGGAAMPGHRWPDPLAGLYEMIVRVPAAATVEAVSRLRRLGWRFVAAHGVGEVRVALDETPEGTLADVRRWAESIGGAVVVVRAPQGAAIDPWGIPPDSVELQRRVKTAFDPVGVCNPGKLPGGI
jgi:glycolate oxidase FAD binding subunit